MPTYAELEEQIQRLRDEQQRLREDQEKLKQSRAGNGSANRAVNGQTQSPDQAPPPGTNQPRKSAETQSELGAQPGNQPANGQPAGEQAKPASDQQPDRQGLNQPQAPAQSPPDQKQSEEQPAEQAPEEPKRPLRERARIYTRTHPKTIVAGVILLIAAIVAAIFLWQYFNSYVDTDDAQVDGHLNPISARISGTVIAVYVEDNQYVEAGQPLVDLDPKDYRAARDQAKASVQQAQAQVTAANPNVPIVETSNATTLSTTGSDVRSAQAAVSAASQDYDAKVAAVRQAQVNSTKASLDRARFQLLVDKDEISKQQFDAVVAAEKTAAAAVDSAKAEAEAARRIIDQRQEQLAEARSRFVEATRNAPRQLAIRRADIEARTAAVATARAQAEQASLNLSYTRIFAPVSGVVSQKSVEVGERLEPGEQMLTISQLDDIWITANFKETELKRMRPGQPAEVKVDAFDKTYQGYVESLPGATGAKASLLPPENATGNYVKVVQRLPVRIRLNPGEDREHRLRPGMSVEPKVWLNRGSTAPSGADR